MSALQYPISDTNPVRIAAGLQGALTLYNESTANTVYVSEYPDHNGFPITPGMTLSWDAAKQLYAYVDANKAATLDVVDNGGQISSPAAIASQILGQGLAQQIAAQIAVSGVPTIDTPTILYNNTANASNQLAQNIDVSKYQSVSIFIIEKQTSGADPAAPSTVGPSLMRDVFIDFSSSSLGPLPPPLREYKASYLGGGSQGTGSVPQLVAVVPVIGDRLAVTVNGNDAGIAALTSQLIIVGSYRSVSKAKISTWNVYSTHDGFLAGYASAGTTRWETATIPANTTYTSTPPTVSGPGQIAVYIGSAIAAPGVTITVQEQENGAVLEAELSATAAGLTLFPVNFPGSPLLLVVKNNSVGSAINAVIYVAFLYDIG